MINYGEWLDDLFCQLLQYPHVNPIWTYRLANYFLLDCRGSVLLPVRAYQLRGLRITNLSVEDRGKILLVLLIRGLKYFIST